MSSSLSHTLIALFVAFSFFILGACSNPQEREQYILRGNDYVFEVDMTDSLSKYDVYIYTRVDSDRKGFPLEVIWTSPSGQKYSETTYFNLDLGQKQLYRSGLVPVEWGLWSLELSVPEVEGMRGMGIVTNRNN